MVFSMDCFPAIIGMENLLSEGMFLWGSREGYFKVFGEDGVRVKSLLFFENKLIEEVDKTRKNVVAECGESQD